jgi:hypothetical protein
MTTIVVNPRPELKREEAAPGQAVLAASFSDAWATVGNSYEALTTGTAPGNGARTVPAPHDHDATGTGFILAQAPCKWSGRGGVGEGLNPAKVPPFGLARTYAWAGLAVAYTDQVATLVVSIRGNFPTPPDDVLGALSVELDGLPLQWGVEPSADPDVFLITAGLGLLTAGPHTLAIVLTAFRSNGELWQVIGAEVWPNNNEQLRLPA